MAGYTVVFLGVMGFGLYANYLYAKWLRHLVSIGRIPNMTYWRYYRMLFRRDPDPATESLRKPAAIAGVVYLIGAVLVITVAFAG